MLQPVRTKWRKAHKGRIHGTASRANFINYGAYALKALTPERVKPGRILFEVDGVSEQIAKEALYKASAKLPIKTKTIKRFA